MIKRIRSSMNKKMVCLMSAILVLFVILCIFTFTMFSKKYIYAHYNSVLRLVNSSSRDCIRDYLSGVTNDERMNIFAQELQNICKDEIIDMFYMVVREHSSE